MRYRSTRGKCTQQRTYRKQTTMGKMLSQAGFHRKKAGQRGTGKREKHSRFGAGLKENHRGKNTRGVLENGELGRRVEFAVRNNRPQLKKGSESHCRKTLPEQESV